MVIKGNIILTFFLSLATLVGFSQDFASDFKALHLKNDTTGQVNLLSKWGDVRPNDPERFIACFNYYVQQSKTEIISIDRNKKDDQSFQISDTGTGNRVAYLNSSLMFKSGILQKGFDCIDAGITLHPSRLDMRFGKIYMLGQAENYQAFTKEITETIEYGNSIKNAWLWQEGKPLQDAQKFFLSSMQDYIGTIYNTEDDNLLPLMRAISETVLKYNPKHVESLSNIALTYLIIANYDKALEYLIKAESIAPSDVIVLNNIAQAYFRKNDKVNAKLYYEKIIKVGNAEEVTDAKERLKQLQ